MTPEEVEKTKRFMDKSVVASDRCDVFIEMAEMQVSRDYFGKCYCLAVSYLASHIGSLCMRDDAGAVGSVNSISEGGISIGYNASGSSTDDDLTQTTYGRFYIKLRDNMRPAPFITGSFGFMGV
ncbi:MAG: DUF4054 domain-containing protein [Fibrobacter sp.]|nr:DUF4054 domain-containing protein [Fibrobacter sp.]